MLRAAPSQGWAPWGESRQAVRGQWADRKRRWGLQHHPKIDQAWSPHPETPCEPTAGPVLAAECEPSLPSKSLFRAKASGVFLRFQLLLSPNPDPPALNVCGSMTEVGGIRWYPPDLGMGSPPTVPGRQRFLRLKERREGREKPVAINRSDTAPWAIPVSPACNSARPGGPRPLVWGICVSGSSAETAG